jgi:hypothetical protein
MRRSLDVVSVFTVRRCPRAAMRLTLTGAVHAKVRVMMRDEVLDFLGGQTSGGVKSFADQQRGWRFAAESLDFERAASLV